MQRIIYNKNDGKIEKIIFIVDRQISRINQDANKIIGNNPNKSNFEKITLADDLSLIDLELDLDDSFKEGDIVTLVLFSSKDNELKKKVLHLLESS